MIVVTGAAGFIGSCLVRKLNDEGYRDVVAVDDFSNHEKNLNLNGKFISAHVERSVFFEWLEENHHLVQCVFHLGARTDTTEFDRQIFQTLNVDYSKKIWKSCVRFGLPLVYASSAATYGNGEYGYSDNHELIPKLRPLNPYGDSKQEFDVWVLQQKECPYFWAGLKFFNIYGPNEYHKGRMASVVLHAFKQISETGGMKLFRSHHPDYKDGEQLRDFVHVKDVTEVCLFLMRERKHSAIYNLGTGKARSFIDLAKAVFKAVGKVENIHWIDTPADIRDKYQYYTQAEMQKLSSIGYSKSFFSLEDGVDNYVKNFLSKRRMW